MHGSVFGANIFWTYTFRFSKQEHLSWSWQSLIFYWKVKWYTVVQPNSLNGPLIGNHVYIVISGMSQFLVWNKLRLLLKANCHQVNKSCINRLCISGLSLSLWKIGYHPRFTTQLTLGKRLTVKYTIINERHFICWCEKNITNYNSYVFKWITKM